MTKTVRLSEKTHKILGQIKERMCADSYDEAVRRLIAESENFSAFGKDPDLPGWEEGEDRVRFRGE